MFSMFFNIFYIMLRVSGSGTFPQPLTPQRERECLEQMWEGSEEARKELIEHNLRLVAHVVKKYCSITSREQEDLLSIGTIGLIKAINTYKSDRGTRLATYTARCIENEILMYFRASRRSMGEISLSEPIETESEGGTLALMDVISTQDDLAEDIDSRDDRERLYRAIDSCLSDREKRIVAMRYGICGVEKPLTQRQIAEKCGISRSYVSRIEKKALQKLEAGLLTIKDTR